jgi:hypothetical protein
MLSRSGKRLRRILDEDAATERDAEFMPRR